MDTGVLSSQVDWALAAAAAAAAGRAVRQHELGGRGALARRDARRVEDLRRDARRDARIVGQHERAALARRRLVLLRDDQRASSRAADRRKFLLGEHLRVLRQIRLRLGGHLQRVGVRLLALKAPWSECGRLAGRVFVVAEGEH